jgi:hypothetical protein
MSTILMFFCNKFKYTAYRKDIVSQNAHGGLHGVMICARYDLDCSDITPQNTEGIECTAIKVKGSNYEMMVVLVYRKPSSALEEFVAKMALLMMKFDLGMPTVVLGDFNDDLSKTNESILTKMMKGLGFNQLVTTPTSDRGTLIDHIYYNKSDTHEYLIDVRDTYYSDHDMTLLSTKLP